MKQIETDLETHIETKQTGPLGTRHNAGKPRWSLVDFDALEPMVRVLEHGAEEYGENNWRKGLKTTEICDSLIRHIKSYLNCEDIDGKSGLPHVGHILCNALFLSYMHLFRPDCDTRYRDPNKRKCCGQWDENGGCTCNNVNQTES